jgi:hypothetical protein
MARLKGLRENQISEARVCREFSIQSAAPTALPVYFCTSTQAVGPTYGSVLWPGLVYRRTSGAQIRGKRHSRVSMRVLTQTLKPSLLGPVCGTTKVVSWTGVRC